MPSKLNPKEVERATFLTKHGLTLDEFERTGLNWDDLDAIAAHHRSRMPELLNVADFVVNWLRVIPDVHSVKVRVKDPDGLKAKIIRKRIESPDRVIDLTNYTVQVTDLIGARALHLFKHQWRPIHEYLQQKCQSHEEPVAYFREGDPAELLAAYEAVKCKTEVHPFGYRSVHYVITSAPLRDTHRIEVQVRTVFEEAWAEIDHIVRYPRRNDDKLLASFLNLFNSAAGNADFMGSFLIALREQRRQEQSLVDSQKTAEAKWKETVSKLAISEREKDELKKQIEAANATSTIDYTKYIGNASAGGWGNTWGPVSVGAFPMPTLELPVTPAAGVLKVCPCGTAFVGLLQDVEGRYRCPKCQAPIA
jgi:putative GTP pyrophosphokinase